MSTLLIEKDQLNDCIRHSQLKNFDFITPGPIPQNPSELIISSKLDEIINTLKQSYDLVIVDNPPVGLVTDGISIIQKMDYLLYIVHSEYSKKNFIENIDKLIIENKIKKLSVILNGFNNQAAGYGYGGKYGYGYGYGYYEENEDNRSRIKKF
jgi:tyrosine-protein kinase Etk/Wzc